MNFYFLVFNYFKYKNIINTIYLLTKIFKEKLIKDFIAQTLNDNPSESFTNIIEITQFLRINQYILDFSLVRSKYISYYLNVIG